MEAVVEQSAAELGRVESLSSAQIKKTKEQHEQLVVRVNDLVEHSRKTNKELIDGIKKNADALAMKPLVQHTLQAARAGEVGARQLANIAYGAAHLSRDISMS